MRRHTIRLFTLAICATAAVPLVTATDADASSRHLRKHHVRMNPGWYGPWAPRYDPWTAHEVRPVAAPYRPAGGACPGNARGIDCKVWPPPIDEDPDRKASGADAGG